MALPSNKETPAAGSAESSAHGDVEALLTALHTWRAQHQAAALPHTSTPSGDRVTVCLRKRPMHALEAESIGSRTGTGEMEYDCITCVNPKLYFHQQVLCVRARICASSFVCRTHLFCFPLRYIWH